MNRKHTEWVKNPKSNRLILVGGKTWRNLVKEGTIKGVINNKDAQRASGETTPSEAKEESIVVLEPIKEEDPPPKQKGKKQNRLAHKEVTELSTQSAIEIIKQNSEALAEELESIAYIEDEDEYNQRMSAFEKQVEQMIYQQLLSKKETPRLKKEVDYDTEYSIVDGLVPS